MFEKKEWKKIYGKPADGFGLHSAGQRATNYKYFATPLRITHSTVQYENPFCELHANRIVLRGSEL